MALVIRGEGEAVAVGRWRGADFELVEYDALVLSSREACDSRDAPTTGFERPASTTTLSNQVSGTTLVKSSPVSAMKEGVAYVNVRTAKNQAGDIRGQVRG
jgi:hypothetical protein